jgi:hypothetical protein
MDGKNNYPKNWWKMIVIRTIKTNQKINESMIMMNNQNLKCKINFVTKSNTFTRNHIPLQIPNCHVKVNFSKYIRIKRTCLTRFRLSVKSKIE